MKANTPEKLYFNQHTAQYVHERRNEDDIEYIRTDAFIDKEIYNDISKQEESASDELEEASKEWLAPQLDKSYVNYGEVKMMELTHFDGYAMLDAIEFGAKWGKNQAMAEIQAQSMALVHGCPEESESEDMEEACEQLAENARKHKAETSSPFFCQTDYKQGVIDGAKWQKEKDESTTEDLGEYINELSKQFPEVSFAKLSRIAVRVAKWQQEQFEKNRLAACDKMTEEEAEIESDFCIGIIESENRQPTFDDAIKYGMRLQKEQMMAKAFPVEIDSSRSDGRCILSGNFARFETGDKVKVIVIKEE